MGTDRKERGKKKGRCRLYEKKNPSPISSPEEERGKKGGRGGIFFAPK